MLIIFWSGLIRTDSREGRQWLRQLRRPRRLRRRPRRRRPRRSGSSVSGGQAPPVGHRRAPYLLMIVKPSRLANETGVQTSALRFFLFARRRARQEGQPKRCVRDGPSVRPTVFGAMRVVRAANRSASRALRRRRTQPILTALRFSIFEMRFNDLLRFDDFLQQSSALNPQSTDSINAALTALSQP